ncbi:hypothetical protein [Micromonospora chalcea]|uniref:hypothetical protein n=1 Tax=Micromonospora chalcea TaxID=1874 RepID=UPI001FC9AE80|nr:hypothetical protein [Micromonospora chalcea]
MLTYPASIPLSTRSLTRLTELIRDRRRALGAGWRNRRAEPKSGFATDSKIRHPDYPFKAA